MTNKLDAYNKATDRLVLQAAGYAMPEFGKFSLPEIVYLLRESFKYKLTYKKVFDMIPDRECNPSAGFCLVGSYYIYRAAGGAGQWKIMETPLHWWLEHKVTSGPLDITYDQFSKKYPYDMGKLESRISGDAEFENILREKAMILGRAAGLE
ncbi:MAG: hypothetical protein LBF28_00255 [Rickettsiales bacterium]|jgi:hypothetical protein|nr:hypothetical protein [Rickettsiales bacterium]